MREPKDRLCVALDVPKLAEAESLVRELRDEVGMFKIGIELYSAEGPRGRWSGCASWAVACFWI